MLIDATNLILIKNIIIIFLFIIMNQCEYTVDGDYKCYEHLTFSKSLAKTTSRTAARTVYSSPSRTIGYTNISYRDKLIQGPCNPGYVDVTHGRSRWRLCGRKCQGGKYLTDYMCKCACQQLTIPPTQ
jgi:hypothetical protein